jgi:hypothetical protein
LFFDGSDVGLTTSSEDIDALYETAAGLLLISTTGSPEVTGVSGEDEDILQFTPTSLGATTAGTWAMFFDASVVGFGDSSYEDINGVGFLGAELLFTTVGSYSAAGGSGDDEDNSCYAGTFGSSPAGTAWLEFDLSTLGISTTEEVDGISYREQ